MNEFESYSFLLTDSIFGNVLIYGHPEFVLYVMKNLGGYDNHKIFMLSILGFTIAIMFNYFCGLVLHKIYKATVDTKKQANYLKCCNVFQKYGFYILCCNIFPFFGSFIPLLSGFVSYGFMRTIIIAVISKSFFYVYYIYL